MNILSYDASKQAHIAPHFDDFWIWGERIYGLNLLEPTILTFSKGNNEIEVAIPRRSLYLIYGQARTDWMHGIKPEHISGKRMVCTLREIGEDYGAEHPEIVQRVLEYIHS